MDATARRLENNLITLGTGSMVFGFWLFIKTALTYVMLGAESEYNLSLEENIIAMALVLLLPAIDMLLRIYVGFSARAQARGKKKSPAYLFAAGFIIFYYTLIIIFEIVLTFMFMSGLLNMIIAIFIDITSVVFLLEVFISSVKLRRLNKQLNAENGGAL